ncbi:MAG: hypothetical protein WBK55_04545 [Alphaproteobacteria bacterium]
MDEIETRLRETSENCFKTYETWRKDQKNGPVRESLQDAIHELRKVASRLEIELAVSERNEMAQKPIPIPPHRDAKHRSGNDAEFEGQRFESDNDHNYNTAQGHSQQRSGGTMKRRIQRRGGEGSGPGNG